MLLTELKYCSNSYIIINYYHLTTIIRNFNIDATEETGKTKSSSSSLTILGKEDMIIPVRLFIFYQYILIHVILLLIIRGTTVATYLHDEPMTFPSAKLDTDSILKKKSQ